MFLQLTTFSICHLKRIDGLDTGEKKKKEELKKKNTCKQQHVTSKKKTFPWNTLVIQMLPGA